MSSAETEETEALLHNEVTNLMRESAASHGQDNLAESELENKLQRPFSSIESFVFLPSFFLSFFSLIEAHL